MSRILHITDLHITDPNESLEQIWTGAAAYLQGEAPFDFIVVSGDLSQRATKDEYAKLTDFARKHLLARLKEQTAARVIFVPGNHDVEWSAPVFDRVPLADTPAEEVEKRISAWNRKPASGGTRVHVGNHAHLELLDVKNEAEYSKRFANVQKFLNKFYPSSFTSTSGCKRFALTSRTPGLDWSSHFFPDEKIIFIGLSSLRFNDQHWHGANIDPASISAAQAHVTELRKTVPDLLVIAVWHHGFSSDVGRPDRLTLRDLGAIYNMGARIGFHGHTHQDDLQEHAFLRGRFVAIATGSLGAGDADLPVGMTNQFSVIELFPTRVQLQRVRRDHVRDEFAADTKLRRLYLERENTAEVARGIIRSHHRSWVINEDGLARVTVNLIGVDAVGSLSLAVLNPPYCNVRGDDTAKTSVGTTTVHRSVLPDRRTRFWAADVGVKRDVEWAYNVSNAVALSREELDLLPKRDVWFPNINADEDVRSHTVRDECDEFSLRLHYVSEATRPVEARPLVEKRTSDAADHQWELDEVETRRVALESDGKTHTLRVSSPIINRRYSIAYKPPPSGNAHPEEALSLARALVERCRGESYRRSPLRHALTVAIERAIGDAFGESGEVGSWVGFAWDHGKRRLIPGFGSFPAASWSSRFRAGSGVAGHAFRHSRGVAWARRDVDAEGSTIYQERTEQGDEHSVEYGWVLCVPLVISLKGPSVGVISFARGDGDTSVVDRKIRVLAQAGKNVANHTEWRSLRTKILAAFWFTLKESDQLAHHDRTFAEACLNATTEDAG